RRPPCPECGRSIELIARMGRVRKYCSVKCNHRAASRAWWQRRRATDVSSADDLEDGDPFLECERENAATSIDLLPADLAEIEREESTPTRTAEKLPGYDVGR